MTDKPNLKKIGLFIIIGLATFIIIIGTTLAHRFLGTSNLVVMYFDESIKGLSVGAPLVFQGVQIGRVKKIDLITNIETLSFSIPVYANIDNTKGAFDGHINKNFLIDEMIRKGLRAKLTSQSILTGQLMIELEIQPKTKISLKSREDDDYTEDDNIPEIPTVMSQIGELSQIHLKESVDKFNHFFDELNDEIVPSTKKMLNDINDSINQNKRITSEAINNFNDAMININQTAKTFNNLGDYLERHPEAIFTGKQ